MNLKKYQGRVVIFIIGIFGFSLLGANPLSSVLLTMAVLIVSPILDKVRSLIRFVIADFRSVWLMTDDDFLELESS